jgi:hypothetical protein
LFLEATDIPFFPLRLSLRENEAKETWQQTVNFMFYGVIVDYQLKRTKGSWSEWSCRTEIRDQ